MSSNELVSVIVPVYNVEDYLKKCVNSIINQTYTNLEIILVDDGSPDNCGKICDEYLNIDSRIRVIHKKNGGLSSARNAGLDIAKGKYISFIDSDDYIKENFIEALKTSIRDAEIAICGITNVLEDGEVCLDIEESPIKDERLSSLEALKKLATPNYFYYVTACNKLYLRSLFDDIRFEEGKINEDEYIVHKLFEKSNKIVTISDKLYFYLQRDSSITHSLFKIGKLDAVYAFIDRAQLFKKVGLIEESKFVTLQSYWLLVKYIGGLNLHKNKPQIKVAMKTVKKALGTNLRRIKLELIFIKKYLLEDINFIKFWTKINYKTMFSKKKKLVYMLATPVHGNLGDQAILIAEKEFLNDIGISSNRIVEINNLEYKEYKEELEKYIKDKDIILIDGGGNLGTLWKEEDDKISEIIERFKNNKTLVFPQTCYYDKTQSAAKRIIRNRKIYSRKNLFIFLRDEASYSFCTENFSTCNVLLCPDIVLYLKTNKKIFKNRKNNENVLLCFRDDCEKVNRFEYISRILEKNKISYKNTSMILKEEVTIANRAKKVDNKLKEFANAELVITDRLHAMVFSALVGTPCIAFDNISKKVSGVNNWIKDLKYIKCVSENGKIEDGEMETEINSLREMKNNVFTIDKNYFKPLEEVIRKDWSDYE